MRAALVIYGRLSEPTGGFMYDRFLTEELSALGVETEVVSLPWRPYARQLADNFDRYWRDQLASLEADIILQDELCHPSLVGLNRWALGPASPPALGIVHHLRCLEEHPPLLRLIYRWIERAYLSTLDGVIFNSHHTRSHSMELLGEEPPAVVAYPGRDHMQAELGQLHAPGSKGPPELLFVGGLTRRKGLHTLLDALERLADLPWRLHIVGREDLEPNYSDEIRKRAAAPENRGRVEIHGHLERGELERRYLSADLFVVPSQLEGFGMVYLEAMGFGLPVIASANGGATELIEHGENGFLVPPEAPGALSDILRPLLQDRENRRAIGRAGRARFETHPTWRSSTQIVFEFIHRFTEEDKRPMPT